MEQFTRECLEVDNNPSASPVKVNGSETGGAGGNVHANDRKKADMNAMSAKDSIKRPEYNDSNSKKSELFTTGSGASMEQIYESAARLVKRTLDVEGAIVLDVSHADVLETFGAESSTLISIHSADTAPVPQGQQIQGKVPGGVNGTVLGAGRTTTRPLCAEEHAKLQEFFEKFPNGKISEGVVPAALRCFLPSRIQYALCEFSFFVPVDLGSMAIVRLIKPFSISAQLSRSSTSTNGLSRFCVRIAQASVQRPL